MGIPMMYGTCRGGPWNNKQMAHAETPFPVLIEPGTGKGWAAQIAPTTDRPGKKGEYVWSAANQAWDWSDTPRLTPRIGG